MRYSECYDEEKKALFEKLYQEICEARKKNKVGPLPIEDFLLCQFSNGEYYLYFYPDIDD